MKHDTTDKFLLACISVALLAISFLAYDLLHHIAAEGVDIVMHELGCDQCEKHAE